MTLNVAICDDDIKDLQYEKALIHSIFTDKQIQHTIKIFSSPQELLASDLKYDMVFLDIEMNDLSGIDLAKRILAEKKDCFVFFITNYSIYLDNAFDIKAFRYLSKPLDETRLRSGIDSAIDKIHDAISTISLTNFQNKLTVNIVLSSIIYIETNRRRTHVVSADYNFIAEEPFSVVKKQIETQVKYFAMPHQSFFVNLRYVTDYNKQDVFLIYGNKQYKIDMSRRGYADFDKKMFLMAGELK